MDYINHSSLGTPSKTNPKQNFIRMAKTQLMVRWPMTLGHEILSYKTFCCKKWKLGKGKARKERYTEAKDIKG